MVDEFVGVRARLFERVDLADCRRVNRNSRSGSGGRWLSRGGGRRFLATPALSRHQTSTKQTEHVTPRNHDTNNTRGYDQHP